MKECPECVKTYPWPCEDCLATFEPEENELPCSMCGEAVSVPINVPDYFQPTCPKCYGKE